jgi:hypothetical protein
MISCVIERDQSPTKARIVINKWSIANKVCCNSQWRQRPYGGLMKVGSLKLNETEFFAAV